MSKKPWIPAILLPVLLFAFAVSLLTANAGAQANILLSPQTRYQTIEGWEATAQAGQDMSGFSLYKNQLFDQAVNDLGINRLRVEVHTISSTNAAPNLTVLDDEMDNVVLPMRQRLQAQGESLEVNVCYVAFRDSTNLKADPPRYANNILSVFQHIKSKYGFAPDSVEVQLEPDSVSAGQWTGTQVGNALVAAGDLLKANGFNPKFIAPSTTSMLHASQYVDQIAQVSGAMTYLTELAYHRYADVSLANLQTIVSRSQQYKLNTAMLERIGADYRTLHQDLEVANNSAWQQYTLAFPTSDNGAQYYAIDTSNPNKPVVNIGSETKLLRQYFKFIRAGAVRIGATTSNASLDPVAFINPNGRYVVVVNAAAGGAFTIQGLPAGNFGIKYTTATQYDVNLADVTLATGQTLNASIPAAGAITIYGKSNTSPTPTPTQTPPPAPQPVTLLTPVDGRVLFITTVALKWTASNRASQYHIQVRRDSTSGTIVASGQSNVATFVTPALATNTTFYWRAQACNRVGCSNWSSYWTFTVKPPAQPVQLAPTNGQTVANPVRLDWTDSKGATYYRVRVRQDSPTGALVVRTNPTSSSNTSTLEGGHWYYWRVSACSTAGCSLGTGWWSFKLP